MMAEVVTAGGAFKLPYISGPVPKYLKKNTKINATVKGQESR
jgi:hypothetical protein